LDKVIEVVGHPCREELTQRHTAERGVSTAAIEIGVRETQAGQLLQVVSPQPRELVEQAVERSPLRRGELREAIERVERASVTVFQDDFYARRRPLIIR